jgi:hypothetical protein
LQKGGPVSSHQQEIAPAKLNFDPKGKLKIEVIEDEIVDSENQDSRTGLSLLLR